MYFWGFKVCISGEQRAKANYHQNSWSLNPGQHQVNATLQKKHLKIRTGPKPTENGATLAPRGPSVHRSSTNSKVLL